MVFKVEIPFVHPFTAREGDWVVIQPGTDRPVLLYRDMVPNYGALLLQFENGNLSSPDDPAEVRSLLTALAASQPRPPRRPRLSARKRRSA
jgi:hypothetical protein